MLLGAYRYTALKSDPEPHHIESLAVVSEGGDGVQAALERGRVVGEAVRVTRDLVNQPGGALTPTAFADRAAELAELKGFEVEVLDRVAIEEEALGGLLGVNRGSTEEPRFVKLAWQPAGPAQATVALVGKGITFDSGGLSLKPSDSMIGMKGDMAGAAAGWWAFSAPCAAPPLARVLGSLPPTRHKPGGGAPRVGGVDHPPLPVGQVLRGVEAEARRFRPPADPTTAVLRSSGVRRVLDHERARAVRHGADAVEVAGLAGEVHGQDRPGGGADLRPHRLGVEAVRDGVHVREHGGGADTGDRLGRAGGCDDDVRACSLSSP